MSKENESPPLPLSSPLAILGAFLYIIRNRFTQDNNLPWVWSPDNTITGIVIEAQYNPSAETEDARPGIYVDRDNTIYNKVSTGNLDQSQPRYLARGLEHYISVANSDIVIDCVSPSRGESLQIADLVQTYLESSKQIIMRTFGFRDFSSIIRGRPDIFDKQTYLHQTTVNFKIEYERRWAALPITPLLNGLRITPDERLATFFLDSMARTR